MQLESMACDNCGKKTDNWMDEKGWFRMTFSYYSSRNNGYQTAETKTNMYVGKELDFCSSECVGEYFKNYVENDE